MNDNERKFFLKRFFSFNVPSNIVTGSNNASFDETDEMTSVKTQSIPPDDVKDFNYKIDSFDTKRPDSLTLDSKTILGDIKEQVDNFEYEQLIKEKDKKIDFGTISRRNKFKKSTDSSKHLISDYGHSSEVNTPEVCNLNYRSEKIDENSSPENSDSQPQKIAVELNKACNYLSANQSNADNRGKLQEQYSIELKPFKRKEVQIDIDNTIVAIDKSTKVLDDDVTPLLALSLSASGSKIFNDKLTDWNNNLAYSSGKAILNYPSIELAVPASLKIKYRNLGKTGLRVSQFGLGTWVTFGSQISDEMAEDIITLAYQSGINLFDTAEVYAAGKAEITLGKILKKKNWRRSSYIITTKLYWGGRAETEKGLSRKHIIEGVKGSLERLQLDYVDIVFANKPDAHTPMEEIVRAFTHLINKDLAFYWGTSRWNSMEIMEAYSVARQFNLIPPICEQAEYNLFQRDEVEIHMPDIFSRIGTGTMTWSPLACGVLSGKYQDAIPANSRASLKGYSWLKDKISCEDGRKKQEKVRELQILAEKLNCTLAQLSIAWCVKNDTVNCVLLGVSSVEQLYENLQSLQIVPKLTLAVLNEIERILGNKPISRAPSLIGKPDSQKS